MQTSRSLRDRMRPVMYICHLYGMGYFRTDFWIAYVVYILLILVNLLASAYTYHCVIAFVQTNLPLMLDLSVIGSAVRLHFRFLSPPLMIAFLSLNKTAVLQCVDVIDHLVPSIRHAPLKPFSVEFFGWLVATLAAESVQLLTYHYRQKFKRFSWSIFLHFVLSNVWIVTPILLHTFLISAIHRGIREINDNSTSIRAWRTYKLQWKQLHRTAIDLTNSVFGVIIIIYMLFTIMDITFFCFAVYISWRKYYTRDMIGYITIVFARAGLTFRLFRTCHNCKKEVMYIIIKII